MVTSLFNLLFFGAISQGIKRGEGPLGRLVSLTSFINKVPAHPLGRGHVDFGIFGVKILVVGILGVGLDRGLIVRNLVVSDLVVIGLALLGAKRRGRTARKGTDD